MKYKLRKYNQVQYADSEEEKKKWLERGFTLESADEKPPKVQSGKAGKAAKNDQEV